MEIQNESDELCSGLVDVLDAVDLLECAGMLRNGGVHNVQDVCEDNVHGLEALGLAMPDAKRLFSCCLMQAQRQQVVDNTVPAIRSRTVKPSGPMYVGILIHLHA